MSDFAANVAANWGAGGERWLAALPATVAGVARDWNLHVAEPFPLTFNWVAPAGPGVVLKLGVPGSPHLGQEAAALTFFGGDGAIRLLRHDPGRGALLLERAAPGTPLRTLVEHDDETATAVLIDVIRRLHRPLTSPVPVENLADRDADFAAHLDRYPGDDPLPRALVQQARELHADLCASAPSRVVLHGDLHHENVLRATRRDWLAIDPHGVAGDPAAELAPILYNPLAGPEPVLDRLEPRLDQLADGLGLPLDRAVAWGFAGSVLSAVWDNDAGPTPPGRAYDVAMRLRPRLR